MSVKRFWESTDLRLNHFKHQCYLNQITTLQQRCYNLNLLARKHLLIGRGSGYSTTQSVMLLFDDRHSSPKIVHMIVPHNSIGHLLSQRRELLTWKKWKQMHQNIIIFTHNCFGLFLLLSNMLNYV